jgi:hypothetical protein
MNITIEHLIELVVRETIRELSRRGIPIENELGKSNEPVENKNVSACVSIDLSQYRTPVLTEAHLVKIDDSVREISIPQGTVITPGAKELIKKRNLIVVM